MVNVLIAGCGYVGTALAERLHEQGHRVWGLRRQPDGLPSWIRPVAADLADPASFGELPADCGFVFYMASAGRYENDEGYRRAYIDGTRNLIAALTERGAAPLRFFLVSSTGVYAQSGGEWVDETSPTEPAHISGRLLVEGERVVAAAPFPTTIVRLAGIYGPGRASLIDRVRTGKAVIPAGLPAYMNRIHLDDCAGTLFHLMMLREPEPLYLGVDNEPADKATVLNWLAERLGVEPPPIAEGAKPSGRASRGNKRCRNTRLLRSGYVFRHPTFREGFASLIETE